MVRFVGLLLLGACLGACAGRASSHTSNASARSGPAEGSASRASDEPTSGAQGDRLKLVVAGLDGKPVDLGARPTIQVIDFWATWCRPCLEQMPVIEGIAARYRDRGVQVVAVSIDLDKRDVEAFASQHPSSVPIFWDHGGRAAAPYVRWGPVIAIPRTIVVDATGRIVASHTGSSRLERSLTRTLERLLAEAPAQPGGTNESQASSMTDTEAAKNEE